MALLYPAPQDGHPGRCLEFVPDISLIQASPCCPSRRCPGSDFSSAKRPAYLQQCPPDWYVEALLIHHMNSRQLEISHLPKLSPEILNSGPQLKQYEHVLQQAIDAPEIRSLNGVCLNCCQYMASAMLAPECQEVQVAAHDLSGLAVPSVSQSSSTSSTAMGLFKGRLSRFACST